MASPEHRLLEQAPDGTIMLGEQGERITASRDFYAMFSSDEEWRLVASGRTLGTIPISNPVGVGVMVVFAGQRWRIAAVDDRGKVLEVERHRSGKIPKFDNVISEPIHDRLSREMRAVLEANDVPLYLDAVAQDFLLEGRAAYRSLTLNEKRLLAAGKDTHILTWCGSEANAVLAFALVSAGLECVVVDVGVTVLETEPNIVSAILKQIADAPPGHRRGVEFVENLRSAKFDEMVPEALLRLWAKGHGVISEQLGPMARELIG